MELNKTHIMNAIDGIPHLENESVDLWLTSPPYFNSAKKYQRKKGYHYTKDVGEPLFVTEDIFELAFPKTKDTGFFAINLGFSYAETGVLRPFYVIERALRFGWFCVDVIIWKKLNPIPLQHRLTNSFEYIFILAKTPHPKYPGGENFEYQHNFFISSICKGSPTASFPIELPNFIIQIFSEENDLVVDPFMGRGTTGWSARKLNRKWLGFEINASYLQDEDDTEEKRKNHISLESWYGE